MRWLTNLLLLAIVAALGGWVYLERQPAPAPAPLLAAPAGGWRDIVIEREGSADIRLQRTAEAWWLREPQRLPASRFHVQLIEDFLAAPPAARYPLKEMDLAAAGLRRPSLSLLIDGERLSFGAQEPLNRHRYLLFRDEVLLARDGVSAFLGSPWWNFIDRRFLPAGASVTALEFEDGRRLDRDSAPAVLAHWQQAAATLVKPLGQEAAGEGFAVVLGSGERQNWQWIGGEQPRLLRPEAGLVYELAAGSLTALLGRAEAPLVGSTSVEVPPASD